jgi:hypothetical protein
MTALPVRQGTDPVGIAVGPTELFTTCDTVGLVVRQAIPVRDDVRVKRVLAIG